MTSASQQAIVGGYLQVVAATHSEKGVPAVNVWCDEEGKLKDYLVNRRATAIWYALPEMAGREVLSHARDALNFDREGDTKTAAYCATWATLYYAAHSTPPISAPNPRSTRKRFHALGK